MQTLVTFQGEREIKRERAIKKERERETKKERERERDKERGRERERQRKREGERETKKEGGRESCMHAESVGARSWTNFSSLLCFKPSCGRALSVPHSVSLHDYYINVAEP
jgi:hypothetical protein